MTLIEKVKGLFGPKKHDEIIFVEDNRSVANCIEEGLRAYDIEPKFKIERIPGCPCLPWVIIDNNCYLINESKIFDDVRGIGIEIFGKQNAFKFARIRAQKENPEMILFAPSLSTDNAALAQKIAESYFDNFDNKEETDGAISSMLAMRLYIDDYPDEEIAKLVPLGADRFLKVRTDSKNKKLIIE